MYRKEVRNFIEKTRVMVFSWGKKDYSKFHFLFRNNEIEIVEQYKYLGVFLFYNGNFKHAAENLYQKGLKHLMDWKIN